MSALRIGWIGTGVMGEPMAAHLMDAGHSVTVHTRTRQKAEGLIARGAAWAENAAAAADSADVVFSMVGFPIDVEATHLGLEGTLAAENPAPLLVDMTTTRPDLARRIHEAGAERGVGCVDAPVSGGDVGARKATLSIMVGGDAAHVREVRPLLELLGGQIVHQGGPGAGQHTKMVNQILIATNMIGVCEGLLYATAAGLDPTTVLESVGSGAAGSWSVANLAPRMIRRDFEPGFFIEHFLKDLGIALDEADRLGLALPGLAMAKKLYEDASMKGLGRKGTQALLLALEHAVKRQGEGRG